MRLKGTDRKNLRLKKLIKIMLTGVGALSVACWMSACTEDVQGSEATGSPYMAAGSMEDAPVVDYVVPQLVPNILTDRQGYSAGDVKRAIVRGRELPEIFSLIDEETGKVVCSGPVEQTAYDEKRGLYSGVADFSQVEKQGGYYLRCDILGESYRFEIREQFYRELFEEAYEELLKACEDDSLSVSEALRLLEVYEWYGGLFPDRNRNDTPDVLEKLQVWVTHMEESDVEPGQEALYAAFLAKFGYNYKKFNLQYATDCLKRAATVFGQEAAPAEKNADSFFALTELYRATSLNTYYSQITGYKSFFESGSAYLGQTGYLYGCMTYLMTRQKVDREMCAEFMERIMENGEQISKEYEDVPFLAEKEEYGSADLLKHALELSCANYILNNYQYTNSIGDFLHYLMGRNPDSFNFYEDGEDRGSYLMLFAQIAASKGMDAE